MEGRRQAETPAIRFFLTVVPTGLHLAVVVDDAGSDYGAASRAGDTSAPSSLRA